VSVAAGARTARARSRDLWGIRTRVSRCIDWTVAGLVLGEQLRGESDQPGIPPGSR
jgi:hypothetical protein